MGLKDIELAAFYEPRGFIKILQWIFAICAFATTCNFSTQVSFLVNCNGTQPVTVTEVVDYPFRLDNQIKTYTGCDQSKHDISFPVDVHSDAEFFVATGVLSFLYATAFIVVYLYADKIYLESSRFPIADFIGTLILAVFWLSGASAWANGLSELKKGADAQNWMKHEDICTLGGATCNSVNSGNFSGIVISILFGFINFILWGSNMWFVYKETTLFESIMKNTATTTTTTANTQGA